MGKELRDHRDDGQVIGIHLGRDLWKVVHWNNLRERLDLTLTGKVHRLRLRKVKRALDSRAEHDRVQLAGSQHLSKARQQRHAGPISTSGYLLVTSATNAFVDLSPAPTSTWTASSRSFFISARRSFLRPAAMTVGLDGSACSASARAFPIPDVAPMTRTQRESPIPGIGRAISKTAERVTKGVRGESFERLGCYK